MTEGTGPLKSGNLNCFKVPIPADYPKDEASHICRSSFVSGLFNNSLKGEKND